LVSERVRDSEQPHHAARDVWLVLAFTLLGTAMRLVSINTRSFWLDETTAVRQATWPIPYMLQRMADNVHPPLFHTLLHLWIHFFGRSELAVRAYPLMWGIAAIPLMYWAAATVYDARVGLYASFILAISPFYIWYAQEARMYTMMLVFALISTACMWKAMNTNRWGWWAGYALASAAGVMTQFFFGFLLIGQGLYFVWFRIFLAERYLGAERRQVRWSRPWKVFADVPEIWGYLASLLVIVAPLAWWIPKVLSHPDLFRGVSGAFNYGGTAPSIGIHFNELLLVPAQWLFGFHSTLVTRDLVAMWPLLITLAFLSVNWIHRFSARTWYLVFSGLIAGSVIIVLGQWQPIILEARYFTAVTVPLVVLTARLFTSFRPRVFTPLVIVLLVLSVVAWTDQSFNPDSIVKWENRAAMGVIADQFQQGDVILLIPSFVSSIPEYYLPPADYAALKTVPLYDRFGRPRNTPAKLDIDLARQVGSAPRVWVIATWQDTPRIELDRVLVGSWLLRQGYTMVQDHKLRQIRVSLYDAPAVPAKRNFFLQPGGIETTGGVAPPGAGGAARPAVPATSAVKP
jgi:uncharacterized membrane protein